MAQHNKKFLRRFFQKAPTFFPLTACNILRLDPPRPSD
jgi:hypothetical protein